MVEPLLVGNIGSRASRRVAFFLIGRAVGDVDAAAVGFPAWDGRRVMLVGIRDAPVVFLFEFVYHRTGGRVAAKPELFDEVLTFRLGSQPFECAALVVGAGASTSATRMIPQRTLPSEWDGVAPFRKQETSSLPA